MLICCTMILMSQFILADILYSNTVVNFCIVNGKSFNLLFSKYQLSSCMPPAFDLKFQFYCIISFLKIGFSFSFLVQSSTQSVTAMGTQNNVPKIVFSAYFKNRSYIRSYLKRGPVVLLHYSCRSLFSTKIKSKYYKYILFFDRRLTSVDVFPSQKSYYMVTSKICILNSDSFTTNQSNQESTPEESSTEALDEKEDLTGATVAEESKQVVDEDSNEARDLAEQLTEPIHHAEVEESDRRTVQLPSPGNFIFKSTEYAITPSSHTPSMF